MLEVLEFVFKSFWYFIGSIMLLGAIASIVNSVFPKHTIVNNYIDKKEKEK